MIDPRAWLMFAALLFLLMGLGLALEPESYAQSAAEWALEGGRSADEARRFTTRLCRALGLFFIAAALICVAGLFLPLGLGERAARLASSPRARLWCGAAATLSSLALSGMKMIEWAAPRRATARGRAAFWSGWGVVFTLMALGAFALSRA